jgi:methionyl-tRNA formyltransferase
LLEIPTAGCINLHASLLPAYRGAAPIQAALAAGESLTGVTTMQMEAGLDSGPILLQREVRIDPDEKAGELAVRLAAMGGELMVKTLLDLAVDRLDPRVQDDSLATLAPKVQKGDGRVDWDLEAREVYDRLRAYDPWPGLTSTLRGQPVKIVDCRPGETGEAPSTKAGTIVALAESVDVACSGGTVLSIRSLQRPGRRALDARSFINGERLEVGDVFGDAVVGNGDEL